MLSNKAEKLYQRIDTILKKDKTQKNSENLNDNIKLDIEKCLKNYLEIKPSTSQLNISKNQNKELVLTYSVSIKRVKDFVCY